LVAQVVQETEPNFKDSQMLTGDDKHTHTHISADRDINKIITKRSQQLEEQISQLLTE